MVQVPATHGPLVAMTGTRVPFHVALAVVVIAAPVPGVTVPVAAVA